MADDRIASLSSGVVIASIKISKLTGSKLNSQVITSPLTYEDFYQSTQPILAGTPDILSSVSSDFKAKMRGLRNSPQVLPKLTSISNASPDSFNEPEMASFYLYLNLRNKGVRTLSEEFIYKRLKGSFDSHPVVKSAFRWLHSLKEVPFKEKGSSFDLFILKQMDPFRVAELVLPVAKRTPLITTNTGRNIYRKKAKTKSWVHESKGWVPDNRIVTRVPSVKKNEAGKDPISFSSNRLRKDSIHSRYFYEHNWDVPGRILYLERFEHKTDTTKEWDLVKILEEITLFRFKDMTTSYLNNSSIEIKSNGIDINSVKGYFDGLKYDALIDKKNLIVRVRRYINRRSKNKRRSRNRTRWHPGNTKWRNRGFRYDRRFSHIWYLRGKIYGSGTMKKSRRKWGAFA